MQNKFNILRVALLLIVALVFSFCGKDEDPVNSDDPSNLAVEVVSVDPVTYTVVIQASGQNVTQYHFFIGNAEMPEETNTTGLFEHTFEGTGTYTIVVRAYGPSGRYISKEQTIVIDEPYTEPIPLNRGYFTPLEYGGYSLVWQDEFNGNSINPDFWGFDIGDGCPNNCGWGNNELEYYRTENAWVSDSTLTIEARKENYMNHSYTSAKLKTFGKKSFQYGRIDIRALLPEGQGMWPALWLLGNNINAVGWPACGEIDIMEMIGGSNRENRVYGTAHWDNGAGHANYGLSYTVPSGAYNFAEAYHVFSIIWDENEIRWFVDDQQHTVINITGADMTEFHQPHWFIFNVAVGGTWPGFPNESTVFPQQMKVDYIRVFQPEK